MKTPSIVSENVGVGWGEGLKDVWASETFERLCKILVRSDEAGGLVPEMSLVFRAFEATYLNEVKVVIIGQEPYPTKLKAAGLAFALPFLHGAKSNSLNNIAKEMQSDLGLPLEDSSLYNWACQGVLLLNNVLTCEEGKPNAHAHIGWQDFTDAVLAAVLKQDPNVVVIAWGTSARSKAAKFNIKNLIESAHPSPQSAPRGFFGSKPFSRANAMLQASGKEPIKWELK